MTKGDGAETEIIVTRGGIDRTGLTRGKAAALLPQSKEAKAAATQPQSKKAKAQPCCRGPKRRHCPAWAGATADILPGLSSGLLLACRLLRAFALLVPGSV
jgi:hypothetical protein